MQVIPRWEADIFWVSQNIPSLYGSWNVITVSSIPLLILRHTYPVSTSLSSGTPIQPTLFILIPWQPLHPSSLMCVWALLLVSSSGSPHQSLSSISCLTNKWHVTPPTILLDRIARILARNTKREALMYVYCTVLYFSPTLTIKCFSRHPAVQKPERICKSN